MSDELSSLEHAVLAKLLDGDDPLFVTLRKQLDGCRVECREFTGHGFYTKLLVRPGSPSAPLGSRKWAMGGVSAIIDGMTHGAGFTLFLTDGMLDVLEGFAFDEPWPDVMTGFELSYPDGWTRELHELPG
jgi:hypothetical protein